ncbi:MAG: D-alanine--D-alanine ligase [Deltaproteobacteria bacterium]|nr:D-alanine--D-alanine ligase [Deltaproteobacteria bacterium]
MKIAIVYNRPAETGSENWQSSQDVLRQVEAVEQAMGELGIPHLALAFDRDLGKFLDGVRREKVDAIFNLCESVDEDARLAGHPAAVFELAGLPFTGSGSLALMLTTDKLLSKHQLKAAGLLTPDYLSYGGEDPATLSDLTLPAIIKPRFEDASIGIDQESVVRSRQELFEKLPVFYHQYGPLLVEQFIAGREFNISLFGYPAPRVLPPAEIDFSTFPRELHRIVGYRAKWDENAFEYHNTNRFFPANLPPDMASELRRVAAAVFDLFLLRDYGRIDVRMDEQGRIHVLEANANPCLSPDAGFVAAAEQDGMNYTDIVSGFVTFLSARSQP